MNAFVKTRLFGMPPSRWMYASVFGSFGTPAIFSAT